MMERATHALAKRNGTPVLLVIALVIVGLAAFAAPVAAEAPAPNPSTATFETRFMRRMIDHHTMAVEMAELCVEKAIHDELQDMCQEMVTTQSQEIELMQSWLSNWYEMTYEPKMTSRAMRRMERMAAMDNEEFEIAFMKQMIHHHEDAIRDAKQCLKRVYHEDLLNLCRNIIETQSAEIIEMEAWLCEWYAICR